MDGCIPQQLVFMQGAERGVCDEVSKEYAMDYSSYFDYEKLQASQNAFSFLSKFTLSEWSKFLSYAQICVANAGDVIISYQENDPSLFIVLKGQFGVYVESERKGKPYQQTVLSEGSVFGELNFIDAKPRSATVKAETDGKLIQLTRASFDAILINENHMAKIFLLDLCYILAHRLRKTLLEMA